MVEAIRLAGFLFFVGKGLLWLVVLAGLARLL
jgi:hypothetical protein